MALSLWIGITQYYMETYDTGVLIPLSFFFGFPVCAFFSLFLYTLELPVWE